MADAKSVWSWRKTVKSSEELYLDIVASVLIGMDTSGWFQVKVVSSQGSVISPWLFNVWCGARGEC